MLISNCHIVMDIYLTRSVLLRSLSAMGVAATWDVVTDVSLNIAAVRWKDNKVVNGISFVTSKQPIQQIKRYCHRKKQRINT